MKEPILTFNSLLEKCGIDQARTIVFRHRPTEPKLNANFDWIVKERPDLFECYQNTHNTRTESALKRASFVASFIRYRPSQALFVGVYTIEGWRTLSSEEWSSRPAHEELNRYGMEGQSGGAFREALEEFDLRPRNDLAAFERRLIVKWPPPERAWYRWADRNIFEIEAIAETDRLAGNLPEWNQIALQYEQLSILPSEWRAALRQWRGVYLITDQSDRMAYVGSAGGTENLLQRWADYSKSGHGGNKLLRGRDPRNFVFSILQRVSPDLPSDDLIGIENSWKHRLRTRSPHGLNEN